MARPWARALSIFGLPTILVGFFLARDAGLIPSPMQVTIMKIEAMERALLDHDSTHGAGAGDHGERAEDSARHLSQFGQERQRAVGLRPMMSSWYEPMDTPRDPLIPDVCPKNYIRFHSVTFVGMRRNIDKIAWNQEQ